MITVSGKAVGARRPLFADWSVPFPPDLKSDGDRITLRDLISRVVRTEVEKFNTRQVQNQSLRVLSAKQIADAAKTGKVDAGGRETKPQKADPDEAVGAALTAFEDGLYLVVLDEEEQRDLDREVYLKPDSRVTFVRLALLAGG